MKHLKEYIVEKHWFAWFSSCGTGNIPSGIFYVAGGPKSNEKSLLSIARIKVMDL